VKVHHLNCGTLYPYGCGELVCHVLLVETGNGLVLIDTGFGPKDCVDPAKRVGPSRYLIRPVLKPEEAAVNQVERLGFRRDDVRHIVITHFDGDHIGGLSDFPDAQIHVTAAEVLGAMRARVPSERFRYRAVQWAHGPKIVEHTPDGEKWRGFAAAKELDEVSPGIVLISLPGAYARPRLRCGRRRPPLGGALRRRLLSPRYGRRNRPDAESTRRVRDGDSIRPEDDAGRTMLGSPSCTEGESQTC